MNETNFETLNAKNEKPVEANELLSQIFALIKDYFIGEMSLKSDCIEYRLLNEQNFRLTVEKL